MTFPVQGHDDALQVRMTFEFHAEQIISLPLVPVGRGPDIRNRLGRRVGSGQWHLYPQTGSRIERHRGIPGRVVITPAVERAFPEISRRIRVRTESKR